MDFDRTHLIQFQQSFLILDVEVFVSLPRVIEFEGMNVRSKTFPGLTLIEAIAVNARGAAQQAERMPRNPRQQNRRTLA